MRLESASVLAQCVALWERPCLSELPCFCCAFQPIYFLSQTFLVIVREMGGSVSRAMKSAVRDGIEDSNNGGEGERDQQQKKCRVME